jgi:methylated-DNA-[protein]-cysteine S-methyltransferase
MQKAIKYVIFKTKWGYFGIAGDVFGLCRTCLPGPNPEKLKSRLLKSLPPDHRASRIEHRVSSIEYRESRIEFDKTFFKPIQEKITAYFEGARVDFGLDVPVSLDGFSDFQKAVLTACRKVKFGRTITYVELARRLGRPAAARAVGNALAKNPLPLIIPCHRVIRSDGSLGGFSAPGGTDTKVRLLRHEKATPAAFKNS